MKKLTLILTVLLGMNMAFQVMAAEEAAPPAPPAMSPEDQAMMEKFKAFSTPGENHQVLNPLVGEWNYEIKMWKAPGTEPEVSSGTSSSSWILGGRFVEDKVSGVFMEQPFEGMGIIGYDNIQKTYNSVWLDNMSTGFMASSGSYDADKKTLTQEGEFTCPMLEGPRWFKSVTTITDPDHHTYDMYMQDESGKEFVGMQISYTRK